MDWSMFLPLAVSGAGAGAGATAFTYLLRRKSKPAEKNSVVPTFEEVWRRKSNPSAVQKPDSFFARLFVGDSARNSSVLGMVGNSIRHTDGSYSRCYRLHLPESFYQSNGELERKLDTLTRVITADLPHNSILSFRYSVGPDKGSVIEEHKSRQYPRNECYGPARAYHDASLDFYQDLSDLGCFRLSNALLWIRIPSESTSASARLNRFFKDVFSTTKVIGTVNDLHGEARFEQESYARAVKFFDRIENLLTSPIRISPLSARETFEALYLSHNLEASSVPNISLNSLIDLRPYLLGETIQFRDWYALHGRTPVAVVTMFIPPQPMVPADYSRLWTQNSAAFRHLVITEFITSDQGSSRRALDKRTRQLRISGRRLNGMYELTPEAKANLDQLSDVRDSIAKSGSGLSQMRLSVLVYGDRISDLEDKGEMRRKLDQLRERCEEVLRWMRTISGAEAGLEEQVALTALYERMQLGESLPSDTGREFMEVGSSLAPFIPGDSPWAGSRRPLSILSTRSGRLVGLNLFDRDLCPTPLCMVLGAPRTGKSAFMGRMILDTLSGLPQAKALAVDFGESFGPMVDILGGRHLRFQPGSQEILNIWFYEGIEEGILPDDVQIELVLGEMLRLARINPQNQHAIEDEKILKHSIRIVYQNIVPMNIGSDEKFEPVLSNLVAILDNYQDDNPSLVERAARLRTILEDYLHQPFLNAPTSQKFKIRSPFDVFELDSLSVFPRDEAIAIAYRVAARMVQSIGQKQLDGSHSPTLLVFDEIHKIISEFPEMVIPMKKGARQGGKHNVVTLFATHNYEDVAPVHDLLKNAGTRIIAPLASEFRDLATDLDFTPAMVDAIKSLVTHPGRFAQFGYLVGNGPERKFEVVQLNLSPLELWQTANPDLINARAKVRRLRPQWSLLDTVLFLAERFPSGINAEQVQDLHENSIPRTPPTTLSVS